MGAWRIEGLQSAHLRDAFDCGDADLNTFLQRYAGQNERQGLSRTYVALPGESEQQVVGYYTISTGQVVVEHLAPEQRRRLPRYPLPVVRLGLVIGIQYGPTLGR